MIYLIISWFIIGFVASLLFCKVDQRYIRVIDLLTCLIVSFTGVLMLIIFLCKRSNTVGQWINDSFLMKKLF